MLLPMHISAVCRRSLNETEPTSAPQTSFTTSAPPEVSLAHSGSPGCKGEGRMQVCGGGGLTVRMGRVLRASVLARTGE